MRFRCLGCGHFNTDISYLPDLERHLSDLLRHREKLLAAIDAEEWARAEAMPSDAEVLAPQAELSRRIWEGRFDALRAACHPRSMAQNTHRQVSITRDAKGKYTVTNEQGGTIPVGPGSDGEFTPIELMLAAIGACTATGVDAPTSRRAEPTAFTVEVGAEKIRDALGNRLTDIAVTFHVSFPRGEGGDEARKLLPGAVRRAHKVLCAVSKTIELGTPVRSTVA